MLATLPEALRRRRPGRSRRSTRRGRCGSFKEAGAARAAAEAAGARARWRTTTKPAGPPPPPSRGSGRTMLGLSGPGPLGGGGRGGRGGRTWPGGETAADRAARAANQRVIRGGPRRAPHAGQSCFAWRRPRLRACSRRFFSTSRRTRRPAMRSSHLLFANYGPRWRPTRAAPAVAGASRRPRAVHVVCSKPDAAARLLAERALETAVFLARHSAHVSRRIPALAVTSSDAADAVAAGALGAKSPPKFANEIGTDETVLAGNRSVLLPAARPDAGSAGGDGVVALLLVPRIDRVRCARGSPGAHPAAAWTRRSGPARLSWIATSAFCEYTGRMRRRGKRRRRRGRRSRRRRGKRSRRREGRRRRSRRRPRRTPRPALDGRRQKKHDARRRPTRKRTTRTPGRTDRRLRRRPHP